jgi:hypothetical protein
MLKPARDTDVKTLEPQLFWPGRRGAPLSEPVNWQQHDCHIRLHPAERRTIGRARIGLLRRTRREGRPPGGKVPPGLANQIGRPMHYRCLLVGVC